MRPNPDDARDLADLRLTVTRAQLLAQAMVGRNRMRGPKDLDVIDAATLGLLDRHLRTASTIIGALGELIKMGRIG